MTDRDLNLAHADYLAASGLVDEDQFLDVAAGVGPLALRKHDQFEILPVLIAPRLPSASRSA